MADESFLNRFRLGGAPESKTQGQGMVLALVLSISILAAVGLILVWLNIERTKLAYRARTLQHEVEQARQLNAKLGVEREHLLSPSQLGKKAEEMGLGPAKPGQIRRMDAQAGHVKEPEENHRE